MKLSDVHVGSSYEVGYHAILRACQLRATGLDVDARELAGLICDKTSTVSVVVLRVGEPYRRRLDGVRVGVTVAARQIEFLVHPAALEYWQREAAERKADRDVARVIRLDTVLRQLGDTR